MTMPTDWWRDFFHGLVCDFWHALPTPEQTRAEVDALLAAMAPRPGGRLLDVPCGSARHACELADRGFTVDAVDGAAAMLAHAEPAVRGRAVTLHHADQRELHWTAAFDGALCLGNSFGYLGDGERGDAAFLAAVRRCLRPGARFVLDATVLENLLPNLVARRWHEAGGILFCSEVRFEVEAGVVRSDYTLARGAEVQRCTAWVRARSVPETVALLRAAGFAAVTVTGERGTPLVPGARACFVATA